MNTKRRETTKAPDRVEIMRINQAEPSDPASLGEGSLKAVVYSCLTLTINWDTTKRERKQKFFLL